MALTTPVLSAQNAFDANLAHVFTFNVYSGSQVTGSKLTIKNNSTLEVAYDGTQTTYAFEHTVPAGTLANGTYYQASIQTMDAQGNLSSPSNTIQFYCYSTPSLMLTNLPTSNLVTNASYNFEATYDQAQSEALDSYIFNLYSSSGILISSSGQRYNTSTSVPLVLSYTFDGFDNNTSYLIEVNAVTVEGTQVTTGQVQIIVQYSQQGLFSTLYLTNNCQNGYITVQSNIVAINGETNEKPQYRVIDESTNDYGLDLRNVSYTPRKYMPQGASKESQWYYPDVRWTEGYEMPDNFTVRVWGTPLGVSLQSYLSEDELHKYNDTDSGILLPVLFLENKIDGIIECGLSATIEAVTEESSIWTENIVNLYPYVTAKQNKNDIHGYTTYDNSSPIVTSCDEMMDGAHGFCLMLKRIDGLYSVSLQTYDPTGGAMI